MKAKVRTFQSGCGDCIFLILEDEKSGESFHIMIDCGVFTPKIKAFVEHGLGMRIDMLIVTHYDDDHIAGIIKMLLEFGRFFSNFSTKPHILYEGAIFLRKFNIKN